MRKIGNPDFSTEPTNCHNLDVIIPVGYRVKAIKVPGFANGLMFWQIVANFEQLLPFMVQQ